jgi:hypothetical protein
MTSARQERKPSRRAPQPWLHLRAGLGALGVLALAAGPIQSATTELIVTERHSGLAISGFDPVAYFTEQAARPGRAEIELRHAGATWRFRNEGNRAAFAAHPKVFAPRFGGYDPMALARGSSTAGHPELWLVVEDRLYLFHSEAARSAFTDDPARALAGAERRWPEVQRSLSP